MAKVEFGGARLQPRFRLLRPKWSLFFQIVLTAIDRETGSLSIDPLAAIKYPHITYQVICYLQGCFSKELKDQNDKAIAKSKRGR